MTQPDKVADAAIACLTFCQSTPDPQATAARFLTKLSVRPDWSPEEVQRLEAMIHERLSSRLAPSGKQ